MSFILDALRKAEKKRKRGEIPKLLTAQDTVIMGPKRRSRWPYIIVAALLLNAGIFMWWLSPWRAGDQKRADSVSDIAMVQAKSAQQPPAAVKVREGGKDVPPVREMTAREDRVAKKTVVSDSSSDVEPKKAPMPDSAENDQSDDKATPLVEGEVIRLDSASEAIQEQEASKLVAKPLDQEDQKYNLHQRVFELNDLPRSVRQSLPDLFISVHLYSDEPKSRMINIKGQMVREGQTVTDDLKLEEITPDAVIFSYQGYRFRKKLF
jgi:hypothetical protein